MRGVGLLFIPTRMHTFHGQVWYKGSRVSPLAPTRSYVISTYTWGAAALAHLYRQLHIPSSANVSQIAGYLTLLEAWMHDHLPFIKPYLRSDHPSDMPPAMKWHKKKRWA